MTKPPHRRKATVALGALALAGASVLGTSCDVSPPAATVGSATITQNQLNVQLSAVIQDAYSRCFLQLQGSLPSSLTGVGTNTASSQFASYELATLILNELVAQDLGQRRASVKASDVAAARSDLVFQLESATNSSGGSPCGASGTALLDRLPRVFLDQQLNALAGQEQLAVELGHLDLSTAGLQRYYFTHYAEYSELCLSDIEVASQSQAQALYAAINSGSISFASAAQHNSLDQQTAANGGALQCLLSSQIQNPTVNAALASLAVGQLSQPISLGTAWLLLKVNSRPQLPFEQATSRIREILLTSQDARVSHEFSKITKTSKVTVDPRYGAWSRLKGVVPPTPPASKFVLSPSADVPGGATSAPGG